VVKKTRHIPEYQLPPSVNDGVHIVSYKEFGFNALHDTSEPHRDEHYLLMVSCGGSVEAVIDFDNINISKPFIGLISPAQVHHVINVNITEGYAISFNEELMPPALKPILETYFLQERIFSDNTPLLKDIVTIIKIMMKPKQKDKFYHLPVSHYLLHSLLAMIATDIDLRQDKSKGSRAKQIERDFLLLLQQHFKEWKKPADYAKALHITVSHLNDTIKANSGNSVSAQIQRYIVTEAKRMLYHTDKNIQEIAYGLGYEDNAYFIRLFKKNAGITPALFRKKIRD